MMTRAASNAQALVLLRDVSVARVTLRDAHEQARGALAGWFARRAAHVPRVLVVDDDHTTLRYFDHAIRGCAEVVCMDDAREALRRSRAEAFDAMFVDVLMPCMSGAEFIEQVRRSSQRPLVPIVAMSGAMDDPEVAHAVEVAGATRVLAKPLLPDTVLDELRELGVLSPSNGTRLLR